MARGAQGFKPDELLDARLVIVGPTLVALDGPLTALAAADFANVTGALVDDAAYFVPLFLGKLRPEVPAPVGRGH
jgi:hypothetical protein